MAWQRYASWPIVPYPRCVSGRIRRATALPGADLDYRGSVGPLEEQIARVLGSHDPPSMITRDLSLTVALQRMHRAIVLLAAAIDEVRTGEGPPAGPEPPS